MAKINEQNRKLQLQAALNGLQVAYNEYQNAICDYYKWTGYNDDGELYVLDGHEERLARWCYCQEVLARQEAIVEEIKAIIEGHNDHNEGRDNGTDK